MECFGQAPREAGAIRVRLGESAVKTRYNIAAQEAAERAEESAARAEAVASHPPRAGENGNWQIWDEEQGLYVDSGVICRGESGEQGPPGERGPQGEQGPPGEVTLARLQSALSVFGGAARLDYRLVMEYETEGLAPVDGDRSGEGG